MAAWYARSDGAQCGQAQRTPWSAHALINQVVDMTVGMRRPCGSPVATTLKGEASNSLRRAVFLHRQGEIRDRTFENQSFRASGLRLITAAIVHWNTVYLDRAVRQLRAQAELVPDDLLAHVAPLGWEHIALIGDYVWSGLTLRAEFRPLRDVHAAFLPQAT
jgi:Tn3 transposase DDE domain